MIKVGSEPPPIIQEDPRAILYHSRDSIKDEVNDTPDARRRGYRRMALFSLFFYPSGIQVTPLSNALTELSTVSSQVSRSLLHINTTYLKPNYINIHRIIPNPDPSQTNITPTLILPNPMTQSNQLKPNLTLPTLNPTLSTVSTQARILGEGSLPFAGLYPWTWVTSEEKNFQALQGGLLVREPRKVLAWADKVSQWPMKRIIPSHFENNIAGQPSPPRHIYIYTSKYNINKHFSVLFIYHNLYIRIKNSS